EGPRPLDGRDGGRGVVPRGRTRPGRADSAGVTQAPVVRRALLVAASALLAAASLCAQIDAATADRFAKLALACLDPQYPNKPDAVLDSAADVRAPREFHPAFYGCYDWHSSVHGHWMLVRLLRTTPAMADAAAARRSLDAHLTPDGIAAEVRYLDQ